LSDVNDVDLLVAGAGGGLVGAIHAAELGRRVLLTEASIHFAHGNNTSMSTSMIPGAGTRWQQAADISDSPDTFFDDIMHKTKGSADTVVARALADVSARLVTWLADDVGVPIELVTEFPYPGHSQLRCHTLPGRSGVSLLQYLMKRAEALSNLDILVPSRLVDVHRDSSGQLLAILEYPDLSTEEVRCGSVLLATNGFGAQRDMVELYIPEIASAVYHGSAESRGDAIKIGTKLGAEVAFMDAYQGHAALATPQATLAGWANVMHGGVLVNSNGERFGDETTGYSEFAKEVVAQNGATAVLVLDRRIHDACMVFEDFRQTVESGALHWANDVQTLAATFGLPPDKMSETMTEIDQLARSSHVDRFGRTYWERPLQSPFAGVKVTAALFHTQGGLRVDSNARVLRQNGQPIEGLYASGGAAIGISGHGSAGYLAGNGLLPALGLAFLAAEHIATGNETTQSDDTAGET
jgi:fumarate reductase flavoprotein subunit